MQDIVQDILDGKMNRDIDEAGAGGLWDYAGDIVFDSNNEANGELQANIYYALWDLVDILAI